MKTATATAQPSATLPKADAKVMPLEQFYLSIIVQVIAADNLCAIQQEWQEGGRLWLCNNDSTIPLAHLVYKFERDQVQFGIETRDQRKLAVAVKYAEGLEGFIEKMQRFLRAGRLAAPVKKAA